MAITRLLDGSGRPMHLNGKDPSRLKLTGFALPNQTTYAGLIGSVSKSYRWAFDEALRQSPENALAMRRDGTVMALLRERQMPTANSKWHLEPEDPKDPEQKELAGHLTDIVAHTPRFSRFRLQLLEAVWFGRYGNQLAIGKRVIKGQTRYCVFNQQPVHGDKFIFRWDGTPGVLISQLYSRGFEQGHDGMVGVTDPYVQQLKAQGAVVLPTDRGLALFLETEQWRNRFVIHMHESWDADFYEPQLSGGIYGTGLRSIIYYLWWLRQEALGWLMDYLSRVGAGGLTLIGYEHGNANSEAAAQSVAEQMQENNVLLIPRFASANEPLTSTVERLEPSQAGSTVIMDIIEKFYDAWMERAIVGQSMSGGSDAEGSLGGTGRAMFASNTKFNLIQMDATALDECLTEQLVRPIQRWNFPASNVRVRFVSDIAKPDQKDALDAAKVIFDMGADLVEDEVMSLAGLSVPQPGDKVLSSKQQDPGMGGGMPPGMGPEGGPPGGGPEDAQAQQLFGQAMQDGSLETDEGLAELEAKLGGQNAGDAALAQGKGGAAKFQRGGFPFKYEFREEDHPRDHGQFAEKPGGSGTQKKPAARKAPGSQLSQKDRDRLRENGMTGTFPPADVPLDAIQIFPGTAEELEYRPLMQWTQKTKSGRTSRQYRYTQAFHDRNAAAKFERVMAVEPYLDEIKSSLASKMEDELASERDRDAAAIASVIAETGLRPTDGSDSIAHGHYGIASLLAKHVKIKGDKVLLDFIGKEGVRNKTTITDPANVEYLKGKLNGLKPNDPIWSSGSNDAGRVLKDASVAAGGPEDVKLKDLRTIKATQTAAKVVEKFKGPPPPLTGNKTKDVNLIVKAILKMSGEVAAVLNNTASQARDNYIHPEVFKEWQSKLKV